MEPKDRSIWAEIWHNNTGALLVLMSEVLGTIVDTIVRFLQQEGGGGMNPFQLLFARATVISILSSLYMWWTSVPDFPLGKPEVRGWLVLRAACGFTGLSCFYYSIHYLPLAEATIFRFLVPIPTAFLCSLFLGGVFTRKELLAGLIALIGVIIIAKWGKPAPPLLSPSPTNPVDDVSPTQRLLALLGCTMGVFGPVGAYVTIRIIGSRAHPLISVNYFAVLGMLGSAFALLVFPSTGGFIMPSGGKEWVLLALIGLLGFTLQFFLTKGLLLDSSSKATSMMYTQIIFALICDWAVWRVVPTMWSWVGGGIVIASTGWAAVMKPKVGEQEKVGVGRERETVDEESALLGAERTEGTEEEEGRT